MRLLELTYSDVAALDPSRCVTILPVGAVEAHGPHLPLGTDGVIAQAMARETARRLPDHGLTPVVLPPLECTVAGFARNFPGTFSFRPETVKRWLQDLADNLARWKFAMLAVANAHLDPGHLKALHEGLKGAPLPVAFPDLTRRKLAQRLGEEFQSGACHAGRYEGSVVLAERPDLVKNAVARELEPNPSSLVTAIQKGQTSFEEAGGPRAYFGDPASADAWEGRRTARTLGEILVEAVLEEWQARFGNPPAHAHPHQSGGAGAS